MLGDGTAWNESTPASGDNLINGDDEIRDLRIGVRIRLNKEHNPVGNTSAGGEHKAGSAVAYVQNTTPVHRPSGANLTTPADDGRLWLNVYDNTNHLASLVYYLAGGWFDVQLIPTNFPAGCVPRTALTWGASSPITYLTDSQAAGTEGQSLTSGAWRQRRLTGVQSGVALSDDTVLHDLSANVFTLSAGTYRIEWWATGYKVNRHTSRLRNVTDGATTAVGSCERADATGSTTSHSKGWAEFTIAGQKDFQIEHFVELTNGTNGGGIAANQGVAETYCGVKIQRLA